MGSVAPPYPYPGGTPGAEPPAPTPGAPGHFAWSNWIKQFVTELDAKTAKLTGDSFTGPIVSTVNSGSHNLRLVYDGSTGIILRGASGGLEVRTAAAGNALTNIKAANPVATSDVVTKEYADALADSALTSALPTGSVVMFASTIAPTGWLLCDGRSTTGYPQLAAIVGATVPDLRNRFIVGAGSAYALKATGGLDSVTLTANQSGLPSHTHTATVGNASAAHTHSVDPPSTNTDTKGGSHTHTFSGTTAETFIVSIFGTALTTQPGVAARPIAAEGYSGGATAKEMFTSNHTHTYSGTTAAYNDSHFHTLNIAAFNTGTNSATHTHGVTNSSNAAASAVASHENRPPYYALTFIIKAV